MNGTQKVDSLPLTTLDRVRATMRQPKDGWTPDEDANHTAVIKGVSGMIADFLGRHIELKARTETYGLGPGRKVFRLDANPVNIGEPFSLQHGTTIEGAQAAEAVYYGGDTFSISPNSGTVRLWSSFARHSYVLVTYTGGLMAADGDPLTDLPAWLVEAATLQTRHAISREGRLGSSREVTEGMGSVSEREYGLLDVVREYLLSHRSAA